MDGTLWHHPGSGVVGPCLSGRRGVVVIEMGNLLQGSYIDVHEAARSGHIDEVRCVVVAKGTGMQEQRGQRW